jgi:hypothetical protein
VTLTAILPTLRASLPEPTDPFVWPAHTVTTTDDVLVAAVSMVRLAGLAGTPCVHTSDQAPPRYRPRGWTPREMSVAVASVVQVRRPRPDVVLLELDAVLPHCAVLDQVRLIGRVSTAPAMRASVVSACDGSTEGPFHRLPAPVPSDVRAGDLLCFPCVVAIRHRDVVEPVRAAVAVPRDASGTTTTGAGVRR